MSNNKNPLYPFFIERLRKEQEKIGIRVNKEEEQNLWIAFCWGVSHAADVNKNGLDELQKRFEQLTNA